MSTWRLYDILPKSHLSSKTIGIEVAINQRNKHGLFLIGFSDGMVVELDEIEWKRLFGEDIYPTSIKPCLFRIQKRMILNANANANYLSRITTIEDHSSFRLALAIFKKALCFFTYDYELQIIRTIKTIQFDEIDGIDLGKEEIMIDHVERVVRVKNHSVSYQWVYDVLKGKKLWNTTNNGNNENIGNIGNSENIGNNAKTEELEENEEEVDELFEIEKEFYSLAKEKEEYKQLLNEMKDTFDEIGIPEAIDLLQSL